jgi:hypothetical protein
MAFPDGDNRELSIAANGEGSLRFATPLSEPVDDIEHGQQRATEHPEAYLKHATNTELPSLKWKKSRS